MSGPFSFRFVGAAVAAAFALSLVAPARADVTLELPQTPAEPSTPHPAGEFHYWVNYQDCITNDTLDFAMRVNGDTGGHNLEVWANTTECSALESRKGGTATCWLVYQSPVSSATPTIQVRAQAMVAQLTPDKAATGPAAATAAACTGPTSQKLILTFLVADDTGNALSNIPIYSNTGYDVAGPAAPTGLKTSSGERRLHLSWASPAGADDIAKYQFYCDPPPGALLGDGSLGALGAVRQLAVDGGDAATSTGGVVGSGGAGGSSGAPGTAGASNGGAAAGASGGTSGADASAADAGSGGQTGAGGGVVVPAKCGATIFAAGTTPDSAYLCGSVSGPNASSGSTQTLENGTNYSVAVSAVDEMGNAGPLSNVDCNVPENVTDFFEYYRLLGGEGGGGFCSISAPRGRGGWPFFALLAAGVLVGMLRRSARRS